MEAKKKFGPKLRVRKRADFLAAKKKSTKVVARHWILFFSKNEKDHGRLAVTISGKYGPSVERNKFRRWMRERFRLNQEKFRGFDVHFIARQKPHQLTEKEYKKELHEDFERLLRRFH